MATKSSIISAINGFITSVVNITKHRNSMLQIVNELYTELDFDDHTTETFTTRVSTTINYELALTKCGNKMFMKLYINNNTANTISANFTSPVKIFDWKDNIYKPTVFNNLFLELANQSTGINTARVYLDSVGVYLISSLAPTTIHSTTFNNILVRDL